MNTKHNYVIFNMTLLKRLDYRSSKVIEPINLFQVLKTVRQTLEDLKLAIEGTIIMSAALKETLDAMYDARVPKKWEKVCVPDLSINCFEYDAK